MGKEKSIGRKIASTAVWIIAVPVLAAAALLHLQKEPTVKKPQD